MKKEHFDHLAGSVRQMGAIITVKKLGKMRDNRRSRAGDSKPAFKKLLAKMRPNNLHSETRTGDPVGGEVW